MKKEKLMKRILYVIAAFAVMVAVGCANSPSEKAKQTKKNNTAVNPANIATVGIDVCTDCHSQQTADWLTGHGANNAGRKYPQSAVCLPCHDELGDGYRLVPTLAATPRPTVGCESCHGGGANHYGIGPIAYPNPGYEICGKCHNPEDHDSMTFIEDYKERLPEKKGHVSSMSMPYIFTDNKKTKVDPLCARCHTDEGARDYVWQVPGSTGHDALVAYFANILPYPASELAPVQCGTCHNAHLATTGNPALWMAATVDDAATLTVNEEASAEFNTCTACHQMYKADGPASSTITAAATNVDTGERKYVRGAYSGATDVSWTAEVTTGGTYGPAGTGKITVYLTSDPLTIIKAPYSQPTASPDYYVAIANNVELRIREASGASNGLTLGDKWVIENKAFKSYHDPAVNTHGSDEEIIYDTHAAVPGDTRLNSPVATGSPLFFVKKLEDNACSACHNVHTTSIEINEDYAESGHGDRLADPWIHYDWDAGGSRAACQYCHTTTGLMNKAEDPVGYLPAVNDFSHLLAATTGNNGQNEALYCWGCHTDAQTGDLREPGAIAPGYRDMSGNNITLPDVDGSNVCVICHSGRESGGNVMWSAVATLRTGFDNLSFVNLHYLGASGNIFGVIGYEYALMDYTDDINFTHPVIGTAAPAAAGTGSNGPCVSCHMDTDRPHVFEPVRDDGAGLILVSNVCATCHNAVIAPTMTITELEDEKVDFEDALEAFVAQAALAGYNYGPSHPYFFTTAYDPTYVEATASPHCQKNLPVKNWQTGGTSTFTWTTSCGSAVNVAGTAGTGSNNMGAIFNLNMMLHEPGIFVHNPDYARRLMYDSIDWLNDNLLDDDVKTTLNAAPHAGQPYQAGAIGYLLSDPACTEGVDCRP